MASCQQVAPGREMLREKLPFPDCKALCLRKEIIGYSVTMSKFKGIRRADLGSKGIRQPLIRSWLALPARANRGRLSRRLRKRRIPASVWLMVEQQNSLLACYGRAARLQLRVLASEIVWRKTFSPGPGMILTDVIRAHLASEIAMVILGLESTAGYSSLNWLRNWREVIVYPAPFRPHRQQVTPMGGNPLGLVHHTDPVELGETSYQGPLVVHWHGALQQAPGLVMIHELAHKLDMLDGNCNGHPPLHASMDHQLWHDTLQAAYLQLNRRLESGHSVDINPYAATSPAEFFAVCSEYFFARPEQLYASYPEVYRQLSLLYRQRPLPGRQQEQETAVEAAR